MSFIKLPAKKPRKKLKLNINYRKLVRVLAALAVLAVLVTAFVLALPWLKSKGIVPVADNERRDALHASRDEQGYSQILLNNLEANEKNIADADPIVRYEHYTDKANELTMLERYDDAEQAFLAAEKTGVVAGDPKLAEALYVSFGMMFEAKGDKTAAHAQYLKAQQAVNKLGDTDEMKKIKTEEIAELLERTDG